jgi:RNA polymerase sigma factor (sigma-70 family)
VKVSRATVRLFIAGGEEAIQEVYLSYRSLVFFIIVSIVKNEEDAKDLYQDTFVEAIAKAKTLNNIDDFQQFLTTIARNKALNFVKEKNHLTEIGSLLDLYGEEESHNSLLLEMHDYLSDLENIMVTYHIVYGYGFRDIAELTGIPRSSCSHYYQIALSKIKTHIGGRENVQ